MVVEVPEAPNLGERVGSWEVEDMVGGGKEREGMAEGVTVVVGAVAVAMEEVE